MSIFDNSITIICATYNRSHLIEGAIKSLLNQSDKRWVLNIIDDGSTDKTWEVIKPYLKDSRIKYFPLDNNQGVGFARNYGIKISNTEWIAILDSDNKYKKNAIKKMIIAIANYPDSKIHKFAVNSFDGKPMGERPKETTIISGMQYFKGKFKGESRTLFKKELLLETPFFENNLGAEGLLWKIISLKIGTIVYHSDVIERYYEEGDDRLSLRSKNTERLYKIWLLDIKLLWSNYIKYDITQLFSSTFKMISYWVILKIKK